MVANTPDQYRKRATEFEHLARRSRDFGLRRAYRDLAAQYKELAEQAELLRDLARRMASGAL